MVVNPVDATLDCAPKSLASVDVGVSGDVLFRGVLNDLVGISEFLNAVVAAEFVREDHRLTLFGYISLNHRKQGVGLHIWNDFSDSIAVPFNHAHDDCLAGSPASRLARVFTTDVGLVYLYASRERVNILSHQLANLREHTPSRLIGHSKLSLKLFGRDASLGSRKQECCVEPRTQRRRRLVKDSSRGWRDLIAANITLISLASFHMVKVSRLFAYGAFDHLREALLSKPFKTSIIVGEPLVEVFYRVGFHCLSPISTYTYTIAQNVYVVKG